MAQFSTTRNRLLGNIIAKCSANSADVAVTLNWEDIT